jgi:hypothetical protein
MNKFMRRFAEDNLAACRDNPGIAALFDRWVLPGQPAGSHGLRVAIRNNYLNFYVKGQSVGELRLLGEWPRLMLHRKYHELVPKGDTRTTGPGQTYVTLKADVLELATPEMIDGWIRTAETYAGDEKRFVDDLVAVTPGTIDLEMALPAQDGSAGEDHTAPRMDLVVAQSTDIAFWEAKCAVNGELRARSEYAEDAEGRYAAGPHVLWQLRRYQKWCQQEGRIEQVRDAYVETARMLLAMARLFGKSGPALDAWQALADAKSTAGVILPPGIVVAEYTPRAAGADASAEDHNRSKGHSFAEHRAKLEDHGAQVTCVAEAPTAAVLPILKSGIIKEKLN